MTRPGKLNPRELARAFAEYTLDDQLWILAQIRKPEYTKDPLLRKKLDGLYRDLKLRKQNWPGN
jgi:hypothetical protein